ncbi:uncharacterized protein LOC109283036 [Alligator mississippiensis]|uniref:uncharacterized protein LOC109283036 n=1 Tax=Alligator mississippiensis TaxID=8496 RepID=UPI00287755CD|nr:uncharacterized protein LOC109283036 [Alligator mississippiensis]
MACMVSASGAISRAKPLGAAKEPSLVTHLNQCQHLSSQIAGHWGHQWITAPSGLRGSRGPCFGASGCARGSPSPYRVQLPPRPQQIYGCGAHQGGSSWTRPGRGRAEGCSLGLLVEPEAPPPRTGLNHLWGEDEVTPSGAVPDALLRRVRARQPSMADTVPWRGTSGSPWRRPLSKPDIDGRRGHQGGSCWITALSRLRGCRGPCSGASGCAGGSPSLYRSSGQNGKSRLRLDSIS